MVQDRAVLTMADQWKVVYGLSNVAIFNDLDQYLVHYYRNFDN